MKWLRVGIAALAAFAVWATPAAACQNPSAAAGGSDAAGGAPSAGPNDPVAVTIANVDEGGRWDVYVDGRWVMGDMSQGRTVTESFKMPDLGSSSRTVRVTASVQHEGETWPLSGFTVNYTGTPAASPTFTPAKPQDAPAVQQPAANQQRPASTGQPTGGSGGSGGGAGGAGGPGRLGGGPADPSSPITPVNPASPAAAHAGASGRATAERPTEASPGSRARRPAGQAERRQTFVRVGEPAAPLRAPGPARGTEVPAIALVGLALVVLFGSAGAVLRFIRRTGGGSVYSLSDPSPWIPPEVAVEARARDVLIEAELQEMIAEARARELAEEAEVTPVGPG